ncbi:MAG TPA: Gfo/Idh/MocA family oxidoreductase, partial [Planctomycetota bacterium]|nr:Gfo/Idh/MocA family oxidoreductase [Planctomycetota bacterium]
MSRNVPRCAPGVTRRRFLQSTTTAAAAGALAGPLLASRRAKAAGGDLLRVGLIGCGGRGTGAAGQALEADPNVRLAAMGDLFADRLEQSLAVLRKKERIAGKIAVTPETSFVGFDAYRQVIAASDVVLLCAPPHFRPLHLQAAVESGKHVFAEKPVAVDAPGVRSVLASCEKAREKRLSVVSGLCLRYSRGFQEVVKRIQDGAIGKVVSILANDYRGPIWVKPRQPDWSDMHWQTRNWYYFTWLSGDFNVEQHVHLLDVCSWARGGEYPVSAMGMGGRQVRTGPEYGNIYDHFSVVYEYADGTKLISSCRQQAGCKNDISAQVLGSLGTASLSDGRHRITGPNAWEQKEKDNDFMQTEHDELFRSIRKGEPINNGEYMSKSTLLAILGRMSAYTGKLITWDMAMSSREDLTPPRYEWGP